MKKQKWVVIGIGIVIIGIATVISIFIFYQKNQKEKIQEDARNYVIVKQEEITELKNQDNFYSIASYIDNFYQFLKQGKNVTATNILEESYRTNHAIEEENILDKIQPSLQEMKYYPRQITYQERKDDISIYYIKGKLEYQNSLHESYAILKTDETNGTYAIYLCQDVSEMKEFQEGKKEEIFASKIKENRNNQLEYVSFSDEELTNKIWEDFKSRMLYETKQSYELLEEDCKTDRFSNQIANYQTMVEQQKERIKTATMEGYAIKRTDEYRQFNIIDSDNRKYQFREYSAMNYQVWIEE